MHLPGAQKHLQRCLPAPSCLPCLFLQVQPLRLPLLWLSLLLLLALPSLLVVRPNLRSYRSEYL
jgi:hypothetical protein